VKVSTIGFTKKSAQKFFTLLRDSGARTLIDVRLNNVSQLAGFAKKDDLRFFLAELCGIEYVHAPQLAPQKEALKAYQDGRMTWQNYEAEFIELMAKRGVERSLDKRIIDDGCLLCSEDKPHQCHRRLVVEYLKDSWSDESLVIKHLI